MIKTTIAIAFLLLLAACEEGKVVGVRGGGGTCLPGTDECIESCAAGEPQTCPNPGGTPRTCDCEHPWNQGKTNVV